jgi:alpha-glucosidase
VDAIWLSPITVSPNADWGYDVSDYRDVQPELGGLDELDRLVGAASEREIAVLLDLVPNHTSDRHPWFVDSRSSRSAPRRDWYVWADPKADGAPPNNWLSSFGGPAWTLEERSDQCYLHNFLPEQPDLNWWSDGVRDEFDGILRFWLDRGVAGFRIDVAHALVKDRELRDNPPDPEPTARHPQLRLYNMNRPEVHDVYRRWRRVVDPYEPPRVLLGETWIDAPAALAAYYGFGDELQLAFDFSLVLRPFEADALRAVVEESERELPAWALPAWTLSNHDIVRFPTRWCAEDDHRSRCALLVLLCLRGMPVLYYGDELGLPQTDVPAERRLDRPGLREKPPGRDGARTPMPWSDEPGGGFTAPGVEPWLPFGSLARNVRSQRDDRRSMLSFARDLLAARRASDDLRRGAYATVPAPAGAWAWRRGERTLVAVNLSRGETAVRVDGKVTIGTRRERDGEQVAGVLELGPWEGAVVQW